LESFPFGTIAASLENQWRSSALAIYRNWLSLIVRRK
jgi:hypothetical protein